MTLVTALEIPEAREHVGRGVVVSIPILSSLVPQPVVELPSSVWMAVVAMLKSPRKRIGRGAEAVVLRSGKFQVVVIDDCERDNGERMFAVVSAWEFILAEGQLKFDVRSKIPEAKA